MNSESPNGKSDGLAWLDALCDRFEDALGPDEQFSIEFVRNEISTDKYEIALKTLLQVEHELRTKSGDPPTVEELNGRFPDNPDIAAMMFRTPLPKFPAAESNPGTTAAGRRGRVHCESHANPSAAWSLPHYAQTWSGRDG